MTIILSTIGSRGVTVMSVPSALPESTGGVAIEYGLHDGPLIFTSPSRRPVSFTSCSPSSSPGCEPGAVSSGSRKTGD